MKRVALITGATGGIGRALSEMLAHDGWTVAGMARVPRTEWSLYGSFYQGDVSYPQDCQAAFADTLAAHGQVDALLNCAAVRGPEQPLSWEDSSLWHRTFEVNLMGTVNMCRAVIPHMFMRGTGAIVNFSGGGVGGPNMAPHRSAYVASKAAVVAFTESLALESGSIRINALAPGKVYTGMSADPHKGPSLLKLQAMVRWLLSRECTWSGRLFSADWDTPWHWKADGVAGEAFPFSPAAQGDWCRLRRETFGGAT